MKSLKFKVISKYLRPYKKEFLFGAFALLLVNILSVLIPLEVKNYIEVLKTIQKRIFIWSFRSSGSKFIKRCNTSRSEKYN